MFPNPQEALPLPTNPTLEEYERRAEDLVKACESGDPDAIRAWAARWVESVAAARSTADQPVHDLDRDVGQVAKFAGTKLSNGEATCVLADARFVIARVQGFESWPKFAKHIELLALERSPVSTFEAAADAVVDGDVTTLERLLRDDPTLIHARSTREHRSTLLHYLSANGVENYRQRTPKNAVKVAEVLLGAGAEVDAEANVYGGGATALGLIATSVHPFRAGVQNDLVDVLLKHGARLDHETAAGNRQNLINGCLANGRREAAEYLAARGATLDLEGAAGVGRLDLVKGFFNDDGNLKGSATPSQMKDGFSWACEYGRADVVEFLLQCGVDVGARLRPHGQTGLHWAAYGGHALIVRALIERGALLDVTDETFGTTPLSWALYAWSEEPAAAPSRYHEVVAMLVAAGAVVKPEWLNDERVRGDPNMRAAFGVR
jgi:ankyrin repeat protein